MPTPTVARHLSQHFTELSEEQTTALVESLQRNYFPRRIWAKWR